MNVIAYTAPGGVAVIVPAPGRTAEQALAAVPAGAAHVILDDAALPDRAKRYAWVIADGAVVIDEAAKAPIPATLTPTQLHMALWKASQPADPADPAGPTVLPWAAGMDLPAIVDGYIAGLPAAAQAVTRIRLQYATEIVTSDDALLTGAAAAGFTVSQIEDLLRLAATL